MHQPVKVTKMGKTAHTILGTLLMLFAALQPPPTSAQNNPVFSESLTLTVYLDGYVLVNHKLHLNQTYPSQNITLLGQKQDQLLILDEQNLPLDYLQQGNTTTIYSIGANQLKISYITQDLTSKTGRYWTVKTESTTNITIILPEKTSIISLNTIPELIESSNNQVTITMPPGTTEITYIVEHIYQEDPTINTWPLIALFSLTVPITAFALWFMKRKKPTQPTEPKEAKGEVDTQKLFERETDLRPEEIQVIKYLAEKNGAAFEAELYAKTNLPRTTTWRLVKRLQKMEIIDVRKSRSQNLIAVRKKYMKRTTPNKNPQTAHA